MRQYPKFTKKEIDYLESILMDSKTETQPVKGLKIKGVLEFTPFKNELANKLAKYRNVMRERGQCESGLVGMKRTM